MEQSEADSTISAMAAAMNKLKSSNRHLQKENLVLRAKIHEMDKQGILKGDFEEHDRMVRELMEDIKQKACMCEHKREEEEEENGEEQGKKESVLQYYIVDTGKTREGKDIGEYNRVLSAEFERGVYFGRDSDKGEPTLRARAFSYIAPDVFQAHIESLFGDSELEIPTITTSSVVLYDPEIKPVSNAQTESES